MQSFGPGVETTVIGMSVVFFVLILLTFITWLLNKLVDFAENKRKNKAQKATLAPLRPHDQAPVDLIPASLDAKTIAVIMAAVAASSGKRASDLRFTAIRRQSPSLWAASGRENSIQVRRSFL